MLLCRSGLLNLRLCRYIALQFEQACERCRGRMFRVSRYGGLLRLPARLGFRITQPGAHLGENYEEIGNGYDIGVCAWMYCANIGFLNIILSEGSSGSMSNSGSTQSGSSSMSGDMNSDKKMKEMKSEKGCIRQSNGMYMLEEKGGKMVNLQSSQDLSAHVGHEVKVHGMWQMAGGSSGNSSSGNSSMDSSSSGSMSSNSGSMSGGMSGKDHMGQTFMVDKLDMVSDHCKMDKMDNSKKDKDMK
jgi:hypothetical protein